MVHYHTLSLDWNSHITIQAESCEDTEFEITVPIIYYSGCLKPLSMLL